MVRQLAARPHEAKAGTLCADARGVAAIEMAFVLPILLTLIMGVISYGDWFLTAHTVQQAANDAARAAIAGLTSGERSYLATSRVQTMLAAGALDPAKARPPTVTEVQTTLIVNVVYDASQDPLLHLSFVVPPPTLIRRSAAISLGGL
ncbi:MAG: TadE/TadG family type IV pilus assembly protein [Sphingomonas oligoaromativorans]